MRWIVERKMACKNDIYRICKTAISENYQNLSLSSRVLIIVLFIAFSFMPNGYAQSHADEEEHYDGSEYNASSFKDTLFEKQDYKELRSTGSSLRPLSKEGGGDLLGDSHGLSLKKRQNDKGVVPAGEGNRPEGAKNSGKVNQFESIGPVEDLPGDWVPNKIDLASNGGFGTIPDNGSPVPYTLNGHIEIERGRP